MKFISSIFGVAAVRVAGDAVIPQQGAVVKDLIEAISRRYEFATKPPIQLAAQGQSIIFHGGALKTPERRTGIIQLGMVTNGDFVMAQTTEQADAAISDLTNFLDEAFSYRYKSAEQKRLYLSNVVVQFEKDVGRTFDLFVSIENLLSGVRQTGPDRFQFKRLAFGQGDPAVPAVLAVETIEAADFIIERRAGEPYSSNRFFCSAPMQTEELLGALEKIEGLF